MKNEIPKLTHKEFLEKRLEIIPLAVTGYRAIDELAKLILHYYSDNMAVMNQILDVYEAEKMKDIIEKLVEIYTEDRQTLNDIIVNEITQQ